MHILVVGGTGMLAGVTRWLSEQGHVVSVVSRGRQPFPEIEDGRLHSIPVDYRDRDALRERIHQSICNNGPIGLAVLWIHSDAPNAFRVIVDEISAHSGTPWKLFHVRGSATRLHPELPEVPSNCLYRQVVLGFVDEEKGSRWLTHEEISGALIEAIKIDSERSVVGTLDPWDKRPR